MPPAKPLSPQAFLHTQLSLLAHEQASETSQNSLLLSSAPPTALARAGLAILNLCVSSLRTGLGGRTVLELALDSAVVAKDSRGELPEHGVRTGDIVRVGEVPKGTAKKKEVNELKGLGVEGVVTSVGERAVWVAVGKEGGQGEEVDVPDGRLWV